MSDRSYLIERRSILVLVLLLAGCREGPENLTGVWRGRFDQTLQGRAGTIRLELSHSGASLGGRWEIEIPVDLRFSGRVDGNVRGSTLEARLIPDDPEICAYLWTATVSEDALEGDYEAYDCRVEIVGRIDVRRE